MQVRECAYRRSLVYGLGVSRSVGACSCGGSSRRCWRPSSGVQKEARRQEDFSRGGAGPFIVAGVVLAIVLVVLIALVAMLAAR
ncbi:DUF2970 domain-containing protein [Halomonas smyrnensis]|uniref:DUF2970 domain-containing protein n=1 Tax=Halomonas smyrnensis TaxID=720605 RepID=UPI000A05334F|nr:DUF2970 domain-containing protein [Halomonas smyrnensis]